MLPDDSTTDELVAVLQTGSSRLSAAPAAAVYCY
jgi:hypothetical protein